MRGSLRKYRPLVRRQTPHPSRRRCAAIADAKHRRPFSKYGGRWAAYATFSHKKGREVVLRSLAVIACDKREAFAQGSEATKQSILSLCGAMDCFASLAMTASRMVSFASAFALRAYGGTSCPRLTNLPPPRRRNAPAAPALETSRTASANSPADSSASRPCAGRRIRG